ncbi:MAG: LiaF transmembrane domain-containing protein [Methylocystaceae bacterium]
MNNNSGRMLVGTLLIAVGIIIFGNMYEFWDINLFFHGWWTLFLIVPGAISIIQGGLNIGNLIMVLIGTLLLLSQQGVVNEGEVFKLMFPIILIIIGVFIFWGSFSGKTPNNVFKNLHSAVADSEDNPNYFALFSGNDTKNSSQNLQGGSATAIFGGVTLDLREAKVTQNITFNTTAMFGGVAILVPPQVRVRVTGVPLFGGNDVKVVSPNDESLPLVTFNCISIFGGTEIK